MRRVPPPAGDADDGTLTLLVPGLTGAGPLAQRSALFDGLELPAFRRLLSRAERVTLPVTIPVGLEATLCRLFGADATLSADPENELPVAALSLLADSGEPPDGWWLRADPVHIRTGQDRLFMAGGDGLDIDADEAAALCATINRHFADDGLVLIAPTPSRWYLRWPTPAEIGFAPLPAIVGDDLFAHMPGGEAGRPWRQRLNEIQMLLHADPVNQRRREQGRREISGIWFWGGGELPALPPTPFAGVWSDAPLVQGLARQGGRPAQPLPADATAWLATSTAGLVHIDGLAALLRLGEVEHWQERMRQLERQWLAPLLAALREGRLARLVVSPATAVEYHVTRRRLRRWWRRDDAPTAFD